MVFARSVPHATGSKLPAPPRRARLTRATLVSRALLLGADLLGLLVGAPDAGEDAPGPVFAPRAVARAGPAARPRARQARALLLAALLALLILDLGVAADPLALDDRERGVG